MRHIGTFVKRLFSDESAATLVEYGLLLALVALAAITAMTALGGNISTLFSTAASDL
ncbi:MAG: Flp family type IVb pilin [Candidatus Tyrphobacter sp.]